MPASTAILSPPQLCVMLAGGIKLSPIEQSLGIGVIELPIDGANRVVDGWLGRIDSLNREGHDRVRTVVTLHSKSRVGLDADEASEGTVSYIRDAFDFRGPAGAVKDAAGPVDAERDILICEGGMWGRLDLRSVLWAHRDREADITVCRNPDLSPSGVYFAKGRTLDLIQEKGFMDLKEQWLMKAKSQGATIHVFDCPAPGLRSMRSLEGYLEMFRQESESPSGSAVSSAVFTDGIGQDSAWSLVQDGARVSERALVSEAVVLTGATVEEDAVVVRSIVGPGVRVGAGQRVVDTIYGGGSVGR